jgi:hypothetical protein
MCIPHPFRYFDIFERHNIAGRLAPATCEGTDRFSGRIQTASVANRLPLVICAKLTNVSLPENSASGELRMTSREIPPPGTTS